MGRERDCAERIRRGMSPGQIAAELGISVGSVFDYVDRAIGARVMDLRRYEVVFTIPEDRRAKAGDREARDVVAHYGSDSHLLGDAYELVRRIEVHLHRSVLATLEEKLGPEEHGWWREGVPLKVRQKCQQRREEDATPVEACRYMDLADLGEVMKANWTHMNGLLDAQYRGDRPRFGADLEKVNEIRRRVMHPLRADPPGERDLMFLNEFWKRISESR